MRAQLILIAYLIGINLIGFFIMGIDKQRARKRAFRVPEATLFMIAIIGGSIGSIIGMHLFHHKTRHWYFLFGMPAILLLQLILVAVAIFGPIDFMFF
jgi:uncharacterized membrane protein YsdA (DUF1294 family)